VFSHYDIPRNYLSFLHHGTNVLGEGEKEEEGKKPRKRKKQGREDDDRASRYVTFPEVLLHDFSIRDIISYYYFMKADENYRGLVRDQYNVRLYLVDEEAEKRKVLGELLGIKPSRNVISEKQKEKQQEFLSLLNLFNIHPTFPQMVNPSASSDLKEKDSPEISMSSSSELEQKQLGDTVCTVTLRSSSTTISPVFNPSPYMAHLIPYSSSVSSQITHQLQNMHSRV
jgi:hypothetical protein